jgi:hypothetical protein
MELDFRLIHLWRMKLAGDIRHAEELMFALNTVGNLEGWRPAVTTREFAGK